MTPAMAFFARETAGISLMRMSLCALLMLVMLSPPVSAQPVNPATSADHALAHARPDGFHALCFNSQGSVVTPSARADCVADFQSGRSGVIARDADGKPLYQVFKGPTRTDIKSLNLVGLQDPNGRVVAPAEFERIDPLTPDLVLARKKWNDVYLIRVSDGARRFVPYSNVVPVPSTLGRPLLLAREYPRADKSRVAWILDVNGQETGGKLLDLDVPDYIRTRDLGRWGHVVGGLLTYTSPGGTQRNVTAFGEPVLPGQTLVVESWGLMAPIATAPHLPAHKIDPVYYALVGASGEILRPAPGVLGLTRLKNWWVIVRQDATGSYTYELPSWSDTTRSDLAGPPMNEVYKDIMDAGWLLAKDSRGWFKVGGGDGQNNLWPTAQAAVAALEAGWQATLAELAAEEDRKRASAAAARASAVEALRVQIEDAKRNKPTEATLEGIHQRIAALGVKDSEIDLTGLPALQTEQERYCRRQPKGYCEATVPWSSSFYTDASTTDNMQYLRDQYTSNCAAASLGASRPCWTP